MYLHRRCVGFCNFTSVHLLHFCFWKNTQRQIIQFQMNHHHQRLLNMLDLPGRIYQMSGRGLLLNSIKYPAGNPKCPAELKSFWQSLPSPPEICELMENYNFQYLQRWAQIGVHEIEQSIALFESFN